MLVSYMSLVFTIENIIARETERERNVLKKNINSKIIHKYCSFYICCVIVDIHK